MRMKWASISEHLEQCLGRNSQMWRTPSTSCRWLFIWPRWASRSTAGGRSPLRSQMVGAVLLVGAGVKQVFPLGVPAARGCATAHRPVHETVPGGTDRRLAGASQHPVQPQPSIGGNGRDPWLPHPSKLGKESPFPGVPRGTVGGCRDSRSGWPLGGAQAGKRALPGCAQQGWAGCETLPLNVGGGGRPTAFGKCFSLRAKNGTGWLMNSVQAWQLTAGEQTRELRPSCHP